MGVVGGHNYTPEFLKEMLDDLKAGLTDKSLPFGVDLLLPKVGEGYSNPDPDPNLVLPKVPTLTLTLALTYCCPRWTRATLTLTLAPNLSLTLTQA